jgi:hypothetical protein
LASEHQKRRVEELGGWRNKNIQPSLQKPKGKTSVIEMLQKHEEKDRKEEGQKEGHKETQRTERLLKEEVGGRSHRVRV